jgi:hypothetical protein
MEPPHAGPAKLHAPLGLIEALTVRQGNALQQGCTSAPPSPIAHCLMHDPPPPGGGG